MSCFGISTRVIFKATVSIFIMAKVKKGSRKPAGRRSGRVNPIARREPSKRLIKLTEKAARARENLDKVLKSKSADSGPSSGRKGNTKKTVTFDAQPMPTSSQVASPDLGTQNTLDGTRPPPGFPMYPMYNPFFMMGFQNQGQDAPGSVGSQMGSQQDAINMMNAMSQGFPFVWPGRVDPARVSVPTATVSRPPADAQDSDSSSGNSNASVGSPPTSANGNSGSSEGEVPMEIDISQEEMDQLYADIRASSASERAVSPPTVYDGSDDAVRMPPPPPVRLQSRVRRRHDAVRGVDVRQMQQESGHLSDVARAKLNAAKLVDEARSSMKKKVPHLNLVLFGDDNIGILWSYLDEVYPIFLWGIIID